MAPRFQDGDLVVTETELVTPRGRWPLAGLQDARVEELPGRPFLWIRFVVAGLACVCGALFFASRLLDALAFGGIGAALLFLAWKAKHVRPVHVCVLRLDGRDVQVVRSADRARLEPLAAALRKVCR